MLTLILTLLVGIPMQALTLGWARARVEENPERYPEDADEYSARLQRRPKRYFRSDLTSRQLGRRLWITWAMFGCALLVTVPLDIASFGWESSLFAGNH